jgi:hypothetical protein
MAARKFGGSQPKTRSDDKRGGARPGAGRPVGVTLAPDEATVRKTVTLPQSMVDRLEQLGEGNVSLGIRRLLEMTNA